MRCITHGPDETYAIGVCLGKMAEPGTVIALRGDLGAGKTVFAKGFAEGLGITDVVNSPTFTILQEYPGGRIPMYHFDLYRIEEPDELEELGWEEYFYSDGACLIEWPERAEELLPDNARSLVFARCESDPDLRSVDILGFPEETEKKIQEIS